jgi:hypothetical protein
MSKDMREGWLAELKVGDTVVLTSSSNSRLSVVEKITPTGRLVVNKTVYDHTGHLFQREKFLMGFYRLSEPTKKLVSTLKKASLLKSITVILEDINKHDNGGYMCHLEKINTLNKDYLEDFLLYLREWKVATRCEEQL